VDRCFLIVPCSKCGQLGHSVKNCKATSTTSSSVSGGQNKSSWKDTTNVKSNGSSSSVAALKIKEKFINKNPFPKKVVS
jgi:hypothetical protein